MKCLPHRQAAARDHGRFIGRLPVTVNDDDLVAERGAEAGVLVAVDADVGTHVIAAADFRPPVTKPGPVAGHAAAHDGDQASARLESQEGLLDVAGSEGGAVSVDSASGGREGRVHHDGMISFFQGEEIVETFGIECRRLESLQGEQLTPAWVDFIGVYVCSKEPGENRNIARSGTRLQDRHSGAECGCFDDHEGLGRRRAELLKLNLRLVTSGLDGQSGLFSEKLVDRGGDVAKVKTHPVQIDVEARLGGVIGVTAVPGRTAENLLGQAADCRVVELDRRIGFQECGKTPSELHERTFRRRKRRDQLRFRGPVKIQENLVRCGTTPAARIGPIAAGPPGRQCVVVVAHGFIDVMGGSRCRVAYTSKKNRRAGIATGDKSVNSVDISAAVAP